MKRRKREVGMGMDANPKVQVSMIRKTVCLKEKVLSKNRKDYSIIGKSHWCLCPTHQQTLYLSFPFFFPMCPSLIIIVFGRASMCIPLLIFQKQTSYLLSTLCLCMYVFLFTIFVLSMDVINVGVALILYQFDILDTCYTFCVCVDEVDQLIQFTSKTKSTGKWRQEKV